MGLMMEVRVRESGSLAEKSGVDQEADGVQRFEQCFVRILSRAGGHRSFVDYAIVSSHGWPAASLKPAPY